MAEYKGILNPVPKNRGGYENYSTTEHEIGTWIDGSTLYEKTIDCGALPNATSKNVLHGISNLKRIVEYKGYSYSITNANSLPVPFATNTIFARVNSNGTDYITISTGSDLSAYNETYVTIRYTKTA